MKTDVHDPGWGEGGAIPKEQYLFPLGKNTSKE